MSRPYAVNYQATVWKEGNAFVAAARPLDVMSAGDTEDAARQMLAEAVGLFLKTAMAAGSIDDILSECRYEQRGGEWIAASLRA